MTPKEKAMKELEERKANKPKKISNADLYAGSPMYYYCRECEHIAAVLPETHIGAPPKFCQPCQYMRNMGWLK